MRNWFICIVIVLCSATSAKAILPFSEEFSARHVKPDSPLAAKVAVAKCNVCHAGAKKVMKNEFGEAVGKHLKKADFTGAAKKFDDVKGAAARKAIAEGIEKALDEKSSSGKTYREIIAAGNLPGEGK